MDIGLPDIATAAERRQALLQTIATRAPAIADSAPAHDHDGAFPVDSLAVLRAAGALTAPLPVPLGGLGFGTEPRAAQHTAQLLRLIGRASLPLGRVYEGHVNALRLVCRLGTPDQAARAAADAAAGHLFGVWNTDPAQHPLALLNGQLSGAKILASGAGHVTRALVTAGGDPRPLLLVRLPPSTRADLSAWTAHGMRASATGRVTFDGLGPDDFDRIGPPGAYLAQPDFSAGAWRVLAVQLGGLDALLAELRHGLRARGRESNPHQLARVGAALIAQETAALFVRRAADLADSPTHSANEIVAYVGLARIAVETACLDAMRLAQRSLGLPAFMRPAAVERICRDLATYLRQPVPDETLTEAAAWFMDHDLP